MDKTLLYILENYSYNTNINNDTYNLLGNKELFDKLVKLRNNRYNVELFPPILSYTTRAIDAIIAHELMHAKRILSGVAKQLPQNKKYKNEEEQNKEKEKINKHEEFWTDRQLKKMLPIVNPKYYKKLERKKTLQALHNEDKKRWVTTGLLQTKTGEFWDELFPFSNINRIIK